MQLTTTIKDILQSELIKIGENEFINKVNGKTQITDANKKFAFVYKIMRYDEDVDGLVTNEFFNDFRLEDITADKYFKKMFCNKFIDRQIAAQTVEAFASRVTMLYMARADEILVLYENLKDFLLGKAQTSGHNKSGYNQLYSELPQDEVNMNLNANTQDYADNNTINRAFNNIDQYTTSPNAENLLKLEKVWQNILEEFDLSCFLQLF